MLTRELVPLTFESPKYADLFIELLFAINECEIVDAKYVTEKSLRVCIRKRRTKGDRK